MVESVVQTNLANGRGADHDDGDCFGSVERNRRPEASILKVAVPVETSVKVDERGYVQRLGRRQKLSG
jgi:hypothetical protein